MFDDTMYTPPEMKEYFKHSKKSTYLDSKLNFLKEHNGLRPGCVHLIIGTTSGGKSTLVRTIIKDILQNNGAPNILLWLSEESQEDSRREMISVNLSDLQARSVTVVSEQDYALSDTIDFKRRVMRAVEEDEPQVMILDNLTTSGLYNDLSPREQSSLVSNLKVLAQKKNFALILIAHTRSGIEMQTNKMIDITDIRGNKSVANLAQYCYIMQTIKVGEDRVGTINITKCREYTLKHSLFRLIFDPETRLFGSDRPVDFEAYKAIFKMRNVL